ncbi:MAG: hypothetical protein HY926_03045 [Elusimicrobia bacterium]|nr:hypothetical protein [Elusimicrobiota bacterium]
MEQGQRLRLKLADGSEFEAQGSTEFIRAERAEFMSSPRPQAPAAAGSGSLRPQPRAGQEPEIAWEAMIERKGHDIHLRAKLPGDRPQKDACLVLLAASQKLLHQPKPTAAQLAKWLRVSGYPVQRMDRALQEAIAQGELLSSGSRRARRYELTGPGRIKAFLLAHALAAAINGPA